MLNYSIPRFPQELHFIIYLTMKIKVSRKFTGDEYLSFALLEIKVIGF